MQKLVTFCSSKEENAGGPIRLVYTDENGKFKTDPQAIDVLHQMKGPISVVSLCGRAREGKSFILNQLLGRGSGFQVASAYQPCTKGLWMWTAPLQQSAPGGIDYSLLLLDCEGIDACDQTETCSTQIFSLAILLSSIFIYSQMGGIDEAALDHLSLVTQMTKHIRVQASEREDTMAELGQFSPIFVWLLRDSCLDLDDNAKLTPRDYLELALRPVLGVGKDIEAKNKTRRSIQALFPHQECFALAHPLNNETELQHLDQIQPEFQSGLEVLAKFVFERTTRKQVGRTIMTGPILAGITKSFLEVLNDGAVPTMLSSWQDHERTAAVEAESRYSDVIEGMEKQLRAACQVPHAKIDDVVVVLNSMVAEYEASMHGPAKWQKLSSFLQKSLQEMILHQAKKQIDEVLSEKTNLMSQCHLFKDKIDLLNRQLEASEKYKNEYQKHYEYAIDDLNKISDLHKSRINDLESKYRTSEERCSDLMEALVSEKQESFGWKWKYEELLTKKNADNVCGTAEMSVLKSRNSAAEIAAVRKQAQSAQREANEWKGKYQNAAKEAKDVLEKAASMQESSANQARLREDAIRSELVSSLEEKEKEIKDALAKLACAELQWATLNLELKSAESKVKSYNLECSDLKLQLRQLDEKYRNVKSAAESLEKETQILKQEKTQLEEKYLAEFRRFEEMHERCKAAEKEVKRVNELVDSARAEALAAKNEKSGVQQLALERDAEIERAEMRIEKLEKEKMNLVGEVGRYCCAEKDAISKVASLEARVKQREEEIELLKMKNEEKVDASQIHESNLEPKCTAEVNVKCGHEASPLQIESLHKKVNPRQQDLVSDCLNEVPLHSDHETLSCLKRSRPKASGAGFDSVQDVDMGEEMLIDTKKPKSTVTLHNCITSEDGHSARRRNGSVHYTKFTIGKLRQELAKHGFSIELLELSHLKRKDLLVLYKQHVLHK